MLKQIEYKDTEGRLFLVEVPEEHQNMPEYGIRIGPPDLTELKLPVDYEVRLNNQLYNRHLLTPDDVRRRPEEVKAALMAVLKLDTIAIRNLYK